MTKTLSLDAVDYRLLEALQANARASAEELSEIARLSAPACYRRIQRLRAGGRSSA